MADLQLFVWNSDLSEKIPTEVRKATTADFSATHDWQTRWTTKAIRQMPNKVALHRRDDDELLGLMSYELDHRGLAVEVIYIESAAHSNANLLKSTGGEKKYVGIARALLAYAVQVSLNAGFDGVLYFKAKTDELRVYYQREFGAAPVGRYEPNRLVLWEDAAQELVEAFREE